MRLLTGKYFFLLFSLINSIFANETKQAFCMHLTAYLYDKNDFVSFLVGKKTRYSSMSWSYKYLNLNDKIILFHIYIDINWRMNRNMSSHVIFYFKQIWQKEILPPKQSWSIIWSARNSPEKALYNMSQCMRFPTMWYVRPAKPQISLRIRAVWSEALLVA